jgi:tetratricopeptide (TPR) repeat protein
LAPEGLFAPEIAFRMGQSLLASGQTQEGLRALARFLERPDGALHRDAAHLLVAAQLEADGDPRGALLHFDAVLGSGAVEGPEAAEALIGAARSESALGRRTEAARRYRLYLDRAPAGPHAPEARAALAPSAP